MYVLSRRRSVDINTHKRMHLNSHACKPILSQHTHTQRDIYIHTCTASNTPRKLVVVATKWRHLLSLLRSYRKTKTSRTRFMRFVFTQKKPVTFTKAECVLCVCLLGCDCVLCLGCCCCRCLSLW